jgi:hypothetical protein
MQQLIDLIDWTAILVGALGLAFGGVLKGATGAGAPILAVPLLAWFYGVPVAITLFSLPNLATNLLQAWQFRRHLPQASLIWPFALAGLAGSAVGTLVLVSVSSQLLLVALAAVTFLYIAFRLARPHWVLAMDKARRLVHPVGFAAGVMYGAVGISAPVSITFLNAARLERPVFILTVSVFFAAMGITQVPLLIWAGVMTPELALASAVSTLPIWAAMPLGAFLARKMSPRVFDRVILVLLGLIGLRLLFRALV